MKGKTDMKFGEALLLIEDGKMVQRAGWNGKGMFIFKRPADTLKTEFVVEKVKSLPQSVKDYFKDTNSDLDDIHFTTYLCMKAADGSIVNGWLASQSDMLASDWVEYGKL